MKPTNIILVLAYLILDFCGSVYNLIYKFSFTTILGNSWCDSDVKEIKRLEVLLTYSNKNSRSNTIALYLLYYITVNNKMMEIQTTTTSVRNPSMLYFIAKLCNAIMLPKTYTQNSHRIEFWKLINWIYMYLPIDITICVVLFGRRIYETLSVICESKLWPVSHSWV